METNMTNTNESARDEAAEHPDGPCAEPICAVAPLEASEPERDRTTYAHRATYSPQDDRIRLFFGFRIPKAEWDALRAAGWTWTMKQASDMVAPWTPEREDAARELAGEIDDEDEPREDRSADRAERFSGYLEKREGEAEALADRYDGAPRVHAAQDEGRANRSAARHDRIGARAASKWDTAEYWVRRTEGVIRHALYLELPAVRHRRIKGIESEIRGLEERHAKAKATRDIWRKVAAIEDAEKQTRIALHVAGSMSGGAWEYAHPTNPEKRATSLYSLLKPYGDDEPGITGAQAAALYLANCGDLDGDDTPAARWRAHLALRLAYETQMLEAQGGTLANAEDICAGGFIGRHQIVKVSKDRAGRVSRVYFMAPRGYGSDPEKLVEHGIRAEKMTPGSYRPPTDEEFQAFRAAKAERSASKPKAPPLINPDDVSARRIQDAWNAAAVARLTRRAGQNASAAYSLGSFVPSEVASMTQAEYSAKSAGSYGSAQTLEVREDGTIRSNSNMWSAEEAARDRVPVLCRLRVVFCGNTSGPRRVVVLTDKPRAAVPEFTAAPSAVAVAS